MRLPHRLADLSLGEPDDLDLLEHALLARRLVQHQVALAVSALAQHSDLPVIIQLHSNIIRLSAQPLALPHLTHQYAK